MKFLAKKDAEFHRPETKPYTMVTVVDQVGRVQNVKMMTMEDAKRYNLHHSLFYVRKKSDPEAPCETVRLLREKTYVYFEGSASRHIDAGLLLVPALPPPRNKGDRTVYTREEFEKLYDWIGCFYPPTNEQLGW
jgi:hypothetical protein